MILLTIYMLTGRAFKLRGELLAIGTDPDGKRVAVTIPPGEMLRVLSGPRPDDRSMVDILWSERTLVVFADDIERRCVEVLAKGQ